MSKIKLTEEELLKDKAIIDVKTEEINASSAKKPRRPRAVPHTESSMPAKKS